MRLTAVVVVLVALVAVAVFAGPVVHLNAGLIAKSPSAVQGSAGPIVANADSAVLYTRIAAVAVIALIALVLFRAKKREQRSRP
jgi:hypothetical protein